MKLKFLFFITWLLCFHFAMAQSPGGVSAGLKAWYKANAHTAQPSGWPDQSGNAKHLISGGVNPTWTAGTATFNFNPVFNFTGLVIPISILLLVSWVALLQQDRFLA